MGKNTKFTPELGALLVAEARLGTFVSVMARLIGVESRTVKAWVERGQRPNAPPEERAFADAFMCADAEWEKEKVALINAAARPAVLRSTTEVTTTNERGSETRYTVEHKMIPGDHRAAQWLLSKKYPKRYGDRATAELSAGEHVSFPELQEAADTRQSDIDSLLAEPPPELEEAILRNRESIMGLLLTQSEPESAKKP